MKNARGFTIVRVIARLNVGGPATQALLMTEAFRERGYKSLLVAGEVSEGEGSLESEAAKRGFSLVKVRTLARTLSITNDLLAFLELVKIFRRERPLLVHTHTAKAGTLGRLAAICARVPLRVHTFHGHVFHGYFSPSVTRVFLFVERWLARHTDCIIAVSPSQRKELLSKFKVAKATKVISVPLGFDLDRFLAVPLPQPGSEAGSAFHPATLQAREEAGLQVGWVGRITAIKAPLLFLEAAAQVQASAPQTRFLMVGDGEMRPDCDAYIRQVGITKISLAGWKDDLPSVFGALDLVLLTSINEGTPLALLEAMAAARPFVATDVGGVRDLMAGEPRLENGWERFDNGILVPRDVSVMAAAVVYLLRRPEMRVAMGIAGREFVRAGYSHLRLADDLEQLYLRLARAKGWEGSRAVVGNRPAGPDRESERVPSPVVQEEALR